MADERLQKLAERLKRRAAVKLTRQSLAPAGFPAGVPTIHVPEREPVSLQQEGSPPYIAPVPPPPLVPRGLPMAPIPGGQDPLSYELAKRRPAPIEESAMEARANLTKPNLRGDIANVLKHPQQSVEEFKGLAKSGDVVAAGLKLAQLPIEVASLPFSVADRFARESGYTRPVAEVFAAPFEATGEVVQDFGSYVRDELRTPKGRFFLKSQNLDPERVDKALAEGTMLTSQLAQLGVGLGMAKGATKSATYGAIKGAEYLSRSLAEDIRRSGGGDVQQAPPFESSYADRDRNALPTLPEGGITFYGQESGPSATSFPLAIHPMSPRPVEIGGFKFTVDPSKTLATAPDATGNYRGRTQMSGLMADALQSLAKDAGINASLRGTQSNLQGKQGAVHVLFEDNSTGANILVPIDGISAETIRAKAAQANKGFYDEAAEYGFTSYAEYKAAWRKSIADGTTLKKVSPKRGDLTSLATQSDKLPAGPEPLLPPPAPRPPAPPVEGGVPGAQAGSIQSLFTHEGRISTRNPADVNSPRPPDIQAIESAYRQAWGDYLKGPKDAPPPIPPNEITPARAMELEAEASRPQPTPAAPPPMAVPPATPKSELAWSETPSPREGIAPLMSTTLPNGKRRWVGWNREQGVIQVMGDGIAPRTVSSIAEGQSLVESEAKGSSSAKGPPVKTRALKGEGQTVWMKIKDATTRLADFQERETPYSEQTVKSIVEDVDKGEFMGREMLPSVQVWENPQTGKLEVISGHSRLEAYRRLVEAGREEFGEIKTEIYRNKTFEQAKSAAEKSNRGATPSPVARANTYRKLRESGMSESALQAKASGEFGKEGSTVVKMSALDPKGKALDVLRRFVDSGDVASADGAEAKTQATWVGSVKRNHKDLSLSHENEIYDYLAKGRANGKKWASSEGKFTEHIADIIKRKSEFGLPDILNLNELKPKSKAVDEIEKEAQAEIDEVGEQIDKLAKFMEKRRRLFQKDNERAVKNGAEPQWTAEKIVEMLTPDQVEMQKLAMEQKALIDKKNAIRGRLEQDELGLFDNDDPPPTYRDALNEAKKRLDEGGIAPEGLAAGIPIDAEKVAYIFDPIMKRLRADVEQLISEGKIRDVDAARWVKMKAAQILEQSPEFRNLNAQDKRRFFGYANKRIDALAYEPATGRLYEKTKVEYDAPRSEDKNTMKTTIEREAENQPRLKYSDGVTPLDGTISGNIKKALFVAMGKYVAKQGIHGSNAVEMLNFVDRKSAQRAGALLYDGKRHANTVKTALGDKGILEFINLADKGGNSTHPEVQAMLDWYRPVMKQIITEAKEAGLTTTYAEVFTNVLGEKEIRIVERPIGELDNYFPHDYDYKLLKEGDYKKSIVDGIAEREGITSFEAELLYNKYLKHRIEVKYGHLEKPRLGGDNNWNRDIASLWNYFERTSRRITSAEVLGRKHSKMIEEITKIGEAGGDMQAAQELFGRWLGMDYPSSSTQGALSDIYKSVGSWQVATKLQLLFLLNPSQINNVLLLNGLKNTLTSTLDIVKNFNEYRKFVHESGAITDNTVKMHMKESMSLEGIGGKVMEWTGVTAEERFMRAYSSAVAASWMKRSAAELRGNARLFREHETMLKNLKLDNQIDINEVRRRGHYTEAELKDIGFEGAARTQFLSRPQDMPSLLSDPHWKLFTQFKSFGVQQADLVTKTVWRDIKNKNVKSLAALGIYYPTSGFFVSAMRDGIQGRDRDEETKMKEYIRYMALTGSYGIMFDMLEQSSYNAQGLVSWLAGPTVMDASRLWYGISQIPKDQGKFLGRSAVRQIPIPGLQQLGIRLTRKQEDRMRDETKRKERTLR